MVKRTLSPRLVRAAARAAGEVMRLDIHPADFDQPRHVATLERILEQASAQGRIAVTYDDLSSNRLGRWAPGLLPEHDHGSSQRSQDGAEHGGATAGVRSMPIA